MSELKPCPFCGGNKLKIDSKSKHVYYRHVYVYTVSVRCNKCHVRGGTVSGEVGNLSFEEPKSDKLTTMAALEEKAVEAWNRRADNE